MSDVYDTLSADNQAVVRLRLYDFVQSNASGCSFVDLSTITSADSLSDSGNRALAVDCFQTVNHVGGQGAGVLDAPTYQALMSGGHVGWSKGEKIAAAVVGLGLGYWLLKGKRGRRGPRGRRA